MTQGAPDPRLIEAALAADAQWRSDVLEQLVRIGNYLESIATAQHAQLAGLGEISGALRVVTEAEGAEPETVTAADLLEIIADDLAEAGARAGYLDEDERDPVSPDR